MYQDYLLYLDRDFFFSVSVNYVMLELSMCEELAGNWRRDKLSGNRLTPLSLIR